jgi:hypothetical protein
LQPVDGADKYRHWLGTKIKDSVKYKNKCAKDQAQLLV